jgi:hypothetical protein
LEINGGALSGREKELEIIGGWFKLIPENTIKISWKEKNVTAGHLIKSN